MDHERGISHEFLFNSNFIEVKGSRLHYITVGTGDPLVFVHGVPASSYLWRNIIPTLKSSHHCIALDLIGFGLSDKPDIAYTIQDHIDYFNAFMNALNLTNITFVLHGWGSVIGFNFIANNLDKVKAVAFYEGHIHPGTDYSQLSLPIQQLAMQAPDHAKVEKAIIVDNYFMKKIFPMSMLHVPNNKILNKYNEPFDTPEKRRPLLQYIYDFPLENSSSPANKIISNYSAAMQISSIPKLLLYSVPGFLTPIATVEWCRDTFPNLQINDLGEELHFAQETMPTYFAQLLNNWCVNNLT